MDNSKGLVGREFVDRRVSHHVVVFVVSDICQRCVAICVIELVDFNFAGDVSVG